jgi:CBS domain-containing protein
MIMIQNADLMGSEIINHKLTHIDCAASVLEASKLMGKSGAAELLVTGEASGQLVSIGIVTASDIVTRVVAAELDPSVLTIGDITWTGVPGTDSTDARQVEREELAHETSDEALAVLDGDGRLVGTLRLHECIAMYSSHPESAP